MLDLVIRGGTVVDGTGADPVVADVAVTDGRIAAVGRIEGAATRTIDAAGLIVTPGVVDIHTHYDGQATWDTARRYGDRGVAGPRDPLGRGAAPQMGMAARALAGRERGGMRMAKQALALNDELIKLVYAGPLEAVPWQEFLRALADHVGCDNAAITLQLSRKGLAPMLIWGRTPQIHPDLARNIDDRHAELGHLDPLRNALERSSDILLLEEVTSREALLEDEFYQSVLRPYGIEQALGMYVREPGGLECNVGLTSSAEGLRLGPVHKEFMALLRPHFCIALELFARIHRDESEIEVLTDALDRLTIGTFMVNSRGRVLRSNGAARELIERGENFRVVDGRLSLNGRSDSARFRQVIDQALAARMTGDKVDYVRAFRCTDNGNEELGVLVRAIRRDRLSPADLGPAVVVYATEAGRSGSFKQLIATLFDLSPSEANLAALLTEGLTLAEAAREAGLTESTVRSYSKKIFAKLGVSRQTDLVRLILRSVAMLG